MRPHRVQIPQLNAMPDDQVIVERILSGEKELFELLMRRCNQQLYRVIRSYLKDEDEVVDAMQNAYLKAFDKLSQFRGSASFATWLIRIGINEALMRLKTMKREKSIFLHPPVLQSMEVPDKQLNAERLIMNQETRILLEKAIDHLPKKYRVVYMLREVEGLSNEEVCSILEITDANLKVRLHRAKAMLKENLLTLSTGSGLFEFGNRRCDALVSSVMEKI